MWEKPAGIPCACHVPENCPMYDSVLKEVLFNRKYQEAPDGPGGRSGGDGEHYGERSRIISLQMPDTDSHFPIRARITKDQRESEEAPHCTMELEVFGPRKSSSTYPLEVREALSEVARRGARKVGATEHLVYDHPREEQVTVMACCSGSITA